jgi:hypothetical protein
MVLRIVCVVCLVALVAGGCGGGGHSASRVRATLPRALAQKWAGEADAIAAAAATGQSCRAKALAGSLRDEVIQAGAQVPTRLNAALLDGVNSLADRIVCTPPPQTVTAPPAKPPKKHPPHDHHDHHGHGGDNGDQG